MHTDASAGTNKGAKTGSDIEPPEERWGPRVTESSDRSFCVHYLDISGFGGSTGAGIKTKPGTMGKAA